MWLTHDCETVTKWSPIGEMFGESQLVNGTIHEELFLKWTQLLCDLSYCGLVRSVWETDRMHLPGVCRMYPSPRFRSHCQTSVGCDEMHTTPNTWNHMDSNFMMKPQLRSNLTRRWKHYLSVGGGLVSFALGWLAMAAWAGACLRHGRQLCRRAT